jgi:hypothetical protein
VGRHNIWHLYLDCSRTNVFIFFSAASVAFSKNSGWSILSHIITRGSGWDALEKAKWRMADGDIDSSCL